MSAQTAIAQVQGMIGASTGDWRYDDVLEVGEAESTDLATMRAGHHYHYGRQVWVDGHDHAHIVSNDDSAPLLFCGADATTCYGEVS